MKRSCIILAATFLLLTAYARLETPSLYTRAMVPEDRPWMKVGLSPSARARLLLVQMTQQEKLTLVTGFLGSPLPDYTPSALARHGSAGFVPGIERLGIPPQWQTDAGIGVAQQGSVQEKITRTALPSGLAVAATWDPETAFQGGVMIGAEARASGFNVQLAGGVNLMREPRNGRNFEYGGEDPLLAGVMVGAAVRGIQSNHILSTIKHFAFNDQETKRSSYNAVIDETSARMSDLLAFQLALEQSHAGAVMCSYNRVNGDFSCSSDKLLNQILKKDWGFAGYVMSDWGATHGPEDAVRGLDQNTGVHSNVLNHFGPRLVAAMESGTVPPARLNGMTWRILRSMFAVGLFEHPVTTGHGDIDFEKHALVSQRTAEQGMVLLKNDQRLLPLAAHIRSIAVIGGHANTGVLSGGGSSQVYPRGGNAVPGLKPASWPGPVVYNPSSPLAAICVHAPDAQVRYDAGTDIKQAAHLARRAQVAVVFLTQWATESKDVSLDLSPHQNALIRAVAAVNPRTVVVLETGGPIFLPWATHVGAIVEAWYPGTNGGQAIANILFGNVNPSGRLPATFPTSLSQLPHPQLQGGTVRYFEGAAVGYKWFDARQHLPAFPFGFGLSYTTFTHSDLAVRMKDGNLHVTFRAHNIGKHAGMDVAQVYAAPIKGGWEAPKRLAGWRKLDLQPGASTQAEIIIDPRLLATYDPAAHAWRISAGAYRILLGTSSQDLPQSITVALPERLMNMP